MKINGRRIWYGIAMFLSGLILLLSVVGIAGIWITEHALANTIVQIFDAVGDVTVNLQQVTKGVDQKLESIQTASNFISTAADKLSQNVTDKGLILLLLPEEQEQNLASLSSSLKDTAGTMRDTVSAGLSIYHTIDRLPFVSLPAPSQDQVDKIGSTIGEIQSAVDSLRTDITVFRSGITNRIDKVVAGADFLTSRVGQARDQLANLNARFAIIQESLDQWQNMALTALVIAACLITLFLGWVIYSQVEVLRLYGQRWKAAGQNSVISDPPDQIDGTKEVSTPEPDFVTPENSEGQQTQG
jgi:uncharacterized phage infection (PIP) family protein YhgE